jgi:threonine aldolase
MIADEMAHLLHFEAGGCARIAGLLPRTLPCREGCLEPAAVKAALSRGNLARGRTGVVVMENTHNLTGGIPVEAERMQAVAEVAWDGGAAVHLDGARIFNASVALGRPVRDLARWCDTITFCFSKGLGAPVGSVVCGTEEVIARARFNRRILGGSMRQAGHLAAAAIVALDTMVDRLADDHRHARQVAEALAELPGVEVNLPLVRTNMVYFVLKSEHMSADEFCDRMEERGIQVRVAEMKGPRFRFVMYHDIDDAAVATVCQALREVLGGSGC